MSANQQPWPGAADTRRASLTNAGQMARWLAIDATHGGFAHSGTGEARRIYVPLATAALAGAQSAAHFALVAQLTQATAWTVATGLYAANWADFATPGFANPKYRKNVDGSVQLIGLAKKAAALALPDTILTLPVGFRPQTTHIFAVASALGGYTEVRINTAGAVFIQVGGSAVWTALEGISFDPAQ